MIPSDRPDGERPQVDEWSIVRFDGQREDITMRLESSTAFDRAALIMPLPRRAKFALGHDAVFDDMRNKTKPTVVRKTKRVLFGGGSLTGGSAEDDGARDEAAGAGGVEVVDAQDLGPLRVVTLRGDDARIVGTWLADHGFETPEGLEPIAQEYIDRGWLLAAVRLRGAGDQPIQKLQPLIISFDSDEVVYPLRMSKLASGPTEARVDVVAPEPLKVAGWPERDLKPSSTGSGRLYGGPEPNDRYLTSYRFAISGTDFEEPLFVPAERDDFRQQIVIYDEVDITGQVAIAILAVLAVGTMIVLALRRRRRAA